MIENPPVLTIHRGHRRPDRALLEAFRGAQTSHLADAMEGRGAVDWRIKPLDPANASFTGPALTAHAYPADFFGVAGAAMEAEPGDVIMCANEHYTGTAVIGDLAAGMMRNKGVAAFVTDGLARDRAGIVAVGLPLFAMGISPNSPASTGPGQVGAPVVLGGVQVCSGDIIVGDADGVVVIPLAQADAVLGRLRTVQAAEKTAADSVKAGATSSASWHEIQRHARIIQS
ncbi:MAG: 4-hydroxy-4-methyl-2-oxoglutarate aldolase [Rhodospirillaceae bacterium]|jgi:4-hydroxy-4-methyl-2-oxoglutarate aldolase|nr:4-hydroxy-4-methyl-2-oxoglutarate aldolase [Rhodospirillaceae bacterium]